MLHAGTERAGLRVRSSRETNGQPRISIILAQACVAALNMAHTIVHASSVNMFKNKID